MQTGFSTSLSRIVAIHLRRWLAVACLTGATGAFGQWEEQHDERVVVWKTRLPVDAALALATTTLPYPELVGTGDLSSRHYYFDRHGTNVWTADSVTVPETTATVTASGLNVELVSWENVQLIRHSEYSFERLRTKGFRTGRLALTDRDFIEAGVTAEMARRSEYIIVDPNGTPRSTNVVQTGNPAAAAAIDLTLKETRNGGVRVWRLSVVNAIQPLFRSEIHLSPALTADAPFSPNEHIWYRVDPSTFELVRLGLPSANQGAVTLLLEEGATPNGPFHARQRILESKPAGPAAFFRLRPQAAE